MPTQGPQKHFLESYSYFSLGFGPQVPDYATAKIRLTREGKFRVYSGIVDMGQGNAPTYLQIAGERLNQRVADLELVLPDTGRSLPSGSASASRTTYIFGNALIKAAENLNKTLLEPNLTKVHS